MLSGFDSIHSHYDFMALSYSRLVSVLTTIHGFEPDGPGSSPGMRWFVCLHP